LYDHKVKENHLKLVSVISKHPSRFFVNRNGDIVSFDQHNIRSTSDPPPDLDIAKFQKIFFFTEILSHWEKEHLAKKQFPQIFENLTSTFMKPLMTPSDFVTIPNNNKEEGKKNQQRKISKKELFSSKEMRMIRQQFLRDAKKSGKSPEAIKAGLEKIMILKLNAHEKDRRNNKEDPEEDNNQKDRGTEGEEEEGYVFREDLLSKFHQIPFSSYYTAHLNTSDSSTLPEELIQGLEYLQSLIDSSSSPSNSSSSDSVENGFSYLEDDDLFDPVLQELEEQLATRSKAILSLQQTHFGNPLTRNNESEPIKEVMDYMQYRVKDKKKFLKEQFHLLKMNSSLEVIQGKGETDGEVNHYSSSGSNSSSNSNRAITSYSFGWRMFLDVIKVLEKFRAISKVIRSEKSEDQILKEEEDALKVNYPKNITGDEEKEEKKTGEDEDNEDDQMKQKKLDYQFNPFGEMIGSFNTENDLWIAIVVDQLARQQSSSSPLSVHQFAAVIASLVAESPRTAEYKYGPSKNVSDFLDDTLYPYYRKLTKIQERENLDFPMFLTSEVTGIIEKWSKGMEWRDLVTKATDLDQGDLYRILKRTIELLRSIESSAFVPEEVARIARRAHDQINRYPLTDELAEQPQYREDSTMNETMVMTNGTSVVGTTVVGETSDVELSMEELRELGDAEEEEEEEEIEMEYEDDDDDESLLKEDEEYDEEEKEELEDDDEDDDHQDLGTEKDRKIGSGSSGKGFKLDRTKGKSTHSRRKQYDEEIEDEDEEYDDEEDEFKYEEVEKDGEESEEVNDERTSGRRRF
jgi:hypothetical protein